MIDFSFFENILYSMREVRFNYPEHKNSLNYHELDNILKSNEYVDFIITTDFLSLDDINIENVFINLEKDDKEVELLLFFDIYDIRHETSIDNLLILNKWAKKFQSKYNFEFTICQMDNGNKNEYYFDSNGLGPLYQ